MKITVCYMAQLKQAAGVGSEQVEVGNPCSIEDLARRLADRHGDGLRKLLLGDNGTLQPTNLFFIGDAQAQLSDQLKDGDVLTVLSPIAGGSI
jgi:molybdopterin converting factor small subunit